MRAAKGAALFLEELARRTSEGRFGARPAKAHDADFLRRLFVDTVVYDPPLPPALLDLQAVSREGTYAAAYPLASHFVLLRSGESIGTFRVDFSPVDYACCVDIAVLSSERSGAMGLIALRAWLAAVDRIGCAARLTVAPANPVVRLYQRLGFRPDTSGVPLQMIRLPQGRHGPD